VKSFKVYLKGLWESIGLDWIPILVDDRKFAKHPTEDPELYWSFKDQQSDLKGESLKTVIQDLEKRQAEEEKRQDTIEAKAFALISLTGLASALTIGFVEFIIADHPYPTWFRLIVLSLYALIGFCFLTTTIFASRAIRVRGQKFMSPLVSNLWALREDNTDQIFQEKAATLLQSYINNMGLINDKATYVIAAQHWFRNIVILLFLVPVCFGVSSLISQDTTSPSTPTSNPTIAATITNTLIFTPTLAATSSPTPSPSATLPVILTPTP